MVGRVALVARPEVENLAVSPVVAAAAAEDLPAGEPADEDEHVRHGDVKRLSVHLLSLQFELRLQPGGDRVAALDHPEPLLLVRLAPLQVTRGPHQPAEDL